MSKLKSVGLIGIGLVAGVCVSVGLSAVAQRESMSALPIDDVRQFTSVYDAIKRNYVENITDKKLMTGAIAGMLGDLDPHSSYLDAEAFRDMQIGTQGEFGGVGIEIVAEDGFIRVVSPIEDTPASRAGIRAGDIIIKIDDKTTKGMMVNDAVKLMRGAKGTTVTLTIARKGLQEPINAALTRDTIKVVSVRHKELEPGIGYIRISQFQEKTALDTVNALNKLYEKGPLKGLVLDLRNDPGGLLHASIGVAAAFLPKDVLVVSTDGRAADSKRRFEASPDDYLFGNDDDFIKRVPAGARTVPMVVLINAGSASASEIVAGALQDHKRATVLGTQSFGKGSVQSIVRLTRDTGIKLTTARYYTPNGRSIQAKGIMPDLYVTETAEGDLFPDRMREVDLEKHISNNKEAEGKRRSESLTGKSIDQQLDEMQCKPRPKYPEWGMIGKDFQLDQALNKLAGRTVATSEPVEVRKDGKSEDAKADKKDAPKAPEKK